MSRSPRKSDYAPFSLSPERLHFDVVAGELNHARSKEYLNITNTSSEDIVFKVSSLVCTMASYRSRTQSLCDSQRARPYTPVSVHTARLSSIQHTS